MDELDLKWVHRQPIEKLFPVPQGHHPRPRGTGFMAGDILFLESRRFPLGAMVVSFLLHASLLLLVSLWHPSSRRSLLPDFERERVTYYQVAEGLPDISPLLKQEAPAPRPRVERKASGAVEAQHATQQVEIRPEQGPLVERVLEQPEFETVKTLPRLELPAILMHPPSPTRPPTLDLPRPVPPLEMVPVLPDPGPEVETKLQVSARLDSLLQKPVLEVPPGPPPPEPAAAKTIRLFEDPDTKLQVTDLASKSGVPRLAYSLEPEPPRGELLLPKVHLPGSVSASPQGEIGKGTAPAAMEFGSASVIIPNVALTGQKPVTGTIPGVPVVQVPVPPPPPLVQDKAHSTEQQKQRVPQSLQDYLPSLTRTLPRAGLGAPLDGTKPESPLAEAERQGKEIFTAAINAPNFTSKRGSWIFRFAEIQGPPQRTASATAGPDSATIHLTAPDAFLKVDPRYPPEVIRDKIEGVVVLYAIISKEGEVDPQSLRILRKLDPRLDLAARDALLRWKFKPSLKNGQPVAIQAEITIPFFSHREMFER